MTPAEIELRHLGQDLHLFLRLAATHFTSTKDLGVISKLNELATQYANGADIWKKEDVS